MRFLSVACAILCVHGYEVSYTTCHVGSRGSILGDVCWVSFRWMFCGSQSYYSISEAGSMTPRVDDMRRFV